MQLFYLSRFYLYAWKSGAARKQSGEWQAEGKFSLLGKTRAQVAAGFDGSHTPSKRCAASHENQGAKAQTGDRYGVIRALVR
jgi:hypothetical protein